MISRALTAKHRLKRVLRDLYSRVLFHSGAWRLVDRLVEPRLLILAGHCVEDESVNGGLPPDMKIGSARLERVLTVLGGHFDLVTVGEGVRRLREGARRSMVALSMDDGYRDNATVLPDILERTGGSATVYLESRPLLERRVNWSHKWFWLLENLGPEVATRQFMTHSRHEPTLERLRRLLEEVPGDLAYQAKRVLKYEAAVEDRDAALDRLFADRGGDESALCERIYMSLEEARSLASNPRFELGGHTVEHHALATLAPDHAAEEVSSGRAACVEALGEEAGRSFAYPYGRRWDWNDDSVEAVRAAGFLSAVTTHAAANRRGDDPYSLGRWMIDDGTPLHLLVTEAAGGFDWLRRRGLDLVE